MSEWDFLWDLEGQELIDAMTSGGTYDDWAYIERMERQQYGFDDYDYYDDDYYDEPSAKKNTMVFIDAKKVLNENKSIDIFVIVSRDGGAQTALAAAGIKLFGGVSGDADKAVEAFINDALDYNPDVKCSNHENNHGEGHTCGEHGCGSHSCH